MRASRYEDGEGAQAMGRFEQNVYAHTGNEKLMGGTKPIHVAEKINDGKSCTFENFVARKSATSLALRTYFIFSNRQSAWQLTSVCRLLGDY